MSKEPILTHRIYLGDSKNGKHVWYDAVSSHAATHIADTPGLEALASKITQNAELTGGYMQFHTDMGQPVGMTDLVETEPGDVVVYAKRLNRHEYSVFNLSKKPQPSSFVTTAFELHADGTYELVSTWIGLSDSPSFPGTERETADSKVFWSTHALAWGRQEIQTTTKTMTCPW
jgi:hypothetical protein